MPSDYSNASPRLLVLRLLVWAPLLCVGCSHAWWNTFLDPSQPGNFRTSEIVEIQKSISFNDKPLGVPGATDPTPDDLVAHVEEYRIDPGDTLSIRLLDFLQVGAETDLTPIVVDELGYVNIPQLGLVKAEGLSAYELQQELISRGKQAQIFNPDTEPTVTVAVLTALGRTYNISGALNIVGVAINSGLYPIPRPDFRIREAINQAGGLDPHLIKDIYVFRNQPRKKLVRERKGPGEPASRPTPDEPQPAPPVSPVSLAEMGSSATTPLPIAGTGSDSGSTTRLAIPQEQAEQELIEAISPGSPATQSTTPSPQATRPGNGPSGSGTSRPRWIYENDRFIQAPAHAEPIQPTEPAEPPPSRSPTTEPVDWEELAQEGQQRIIRIPADSLRHGDPNYDIVVRHQDFIVLYPGPTGVFYLNGHVNRPGTYNFIGEEITLRQAIASAAGLDALAWPTRCSITRRIDDNREEILQLDLAAIMEGRDPDFYLKPNDLVDVGTHAIAPLLATIRNAFRLTYGFGFVYDRNFADIDAFTPQANPRDVRRSLLASRFPGLFP